MIARKILSHRSVSAIALSIAALGFLGLPGWSVASPSPKPSKVGVAPVFLGPAGWQHVQGSSDGLGVWLRPGDAGYSQNIIVQSKDGFTSLDTLLNAEVSYFRGFADVFGYAPTDTTVCRNHPAKYISFTYTSSTGVPVTTEVVIAVFGTRAYSARYSKSISQDSDAAAQRSLTTLCGSSASNRTRP